jgi:cysteine-rich repeat protein
LKDRYEGYGIVNPDAAIEAVTLAYGGESFSASTTGAPADRRAWGRKMNIPAGRTLALVLDVPDTADYDVHVYDALAGAKGRPVLRAWSDRAGLGTDEELTWTPTALAGANVYVFVKRIAGSGAFTLTGTTFVCGNGSLEPGEECDDANVLGGDCCSVTCQLEANGTACGLDGACSAGVCMMPDGGAPDAGEDAQADAGPPPSDAGDPGDGVVDAGSSQQDASTPSLEEHVLAARGSGCSCRTLPERDATSTFAGGLVLALTMASSVRARRRRPSPASPERERESHTRHAHLAAHLPR